MEAFSRFKPAAARRVFEMDTNEMGALNFPAARTGQAWPAACEGPDLVFSR
jgi:hypothetical protein